VSRPLLRLLLGDIGFVYPVMSMVVIGPSLPILSCDVYGGNRSFTSYTS
jgi:hypothetical protein